MNYRNTISPKHHSSTKPNYPLECKPNINDLRQLFDDNSRCDNKKSHRHSAIYADAKHTSLDESILDYKGGYHHQSQSIVMAAIPSSRHPDFERVKQKFDKPIASNSPSSSASSNTRNGKKARNFSSFLKFSNKRTTDSIPSNCDVVSQKVPNSSNLTESIDSVDSTKAIAGDILSNKKMDAYMHSSINIDGLKVSDDEEVSIVQLSHKISVANDCCLSLICRVCISNFLSCIYFSFQSVCRAEATNEGFKTMVAIFACFF